MITISAAKIKGERAKLTVPAKMPAAPTPAKARPTIKDGELGAAPQSAEAASNIRMLTMRMTLTEKNVYSFPNKSWNAQHVKRYTEPYHRRRREHGSRP